MTTTRAEALSRPNAEPTINGRCVGHTEYDEKYGTVLVIDWHDPNGCEHVDVPKPATLTCDGWCEKRGEVSMIDTAGFAYCEPCGMTRRQYEPCRKLRPWELRKLQRGEVLARY